MKIPNLHILIPAVSTLLLPAFISCSGECSVTGIASMPSGVAGAFIGKADRSIIIAGGSDFPDKKPWEGGEKVYYDRIYELTSSDGKWACNLSDTRLPSAIGGGCTASDGTTLYCFGGSDGQSLNRTVYTIGYAADSLQVDSISVLPDSFIPAAAVFIRSEEACYIHGTENGGNSLYRFSVPSGNWTRLAGCPDRPISEGSPLVCQYNGKDEALYLIGGRGTDSSGLYLSSAVWEYVPANGKWEKKCDMTIEGRTATLMYSSAVPSGSGHIIVAGGDDGIEFSRRVKLDEMIKSTPESPLRDSLKTALAEANINHAGFCDRIFSYNTITGKWAELGLSAIPLPVVTTAVLEDNAIIIPSGEIHPGVRGRDILMVSIPESICN